VDQSSGDHCNLTCAPGGGPALQRLDKGSVSPVKGAPKFDIMIGGSTDAGGTITGSMMLEVLSVPVVP
jgi:hypothetical protein